MDVREKQPSEKRLIDASALIEEYDRVHIGEPGKARKLIADAPTVDAVEVVRCRECYHKTHDGSGRPYCLQLKMYLNKELDFFCKYGKRNGGAE